jgi:hypothetical protein
MVRSGMARSTRCGSFSRMARSICELLRFCSRVLTQAFWLNSAEPWRRLDEGFTPPSSVRHRCSCLRLIDEYQAYLAALEASGHILPVSVHSSHSWTRMT